MKPLPQNYDHKIVEKKWQGYWEENQLYSWKDDQSREQTYVIDTPPPTVSGVLHMGHIFSYTQADFVARYQRMRGKDVFYPMGFDDNGLPTERLVEKVKKVRPADLGREKFIEVCEEVSAEARKEFRHLFESIALSVDWKQEYHTISAESRKISQLSFLDLFNKDRAYRKLQPMFWDPIDQTAIAQAEVEDKEVASFENYIPFGIVDADINPATLNWDSLEKVNIMTTRPELLGACVALMCHPDDAHKYKGKKAVTPLFNVLVDIKADEKVNKEKGTGLVMCCTFGDETDITWWRTHELNTRVTLNKYGKIESPKKYIWNEGNPDSFDYLAFEGSEFRNTYISKASSKFESIGGYESLLTVKNTIDLEKTVSIFEQIQNKKVSNPDPKSLGAREITINLLKEAGLLNDQKPITHAVKCAERSGAPLEILPTHQWFIKILDQKEQLKAKAAECNWHPEYMRIRINQWIDGLSWDWCISRQRYFGVPFPVWYSKRTGEEGKIILPDAADLPVNPLVDLPKGYTRDEVIGEADVMDTWATSSISPQLSSKGINSKLSSELQRKESPLSLGERVGVRAPETKYKDIPLQILNNARELRKNSTDAEKLIWSCLRDRQLEHKFRRQHPVGKYIADFACIEANFIIELDGGQHNEEAGLQKDKVRTDFLEQQGFEVLRFWNNDVLQNLEGILQTIYNKLQERPHPNPLPEGEGTNPFVLNPARHKKLFPADLRPQAHEIIRTWAFYTIVKAHLHEDEIPWKNLMISGWCLASDKTKMSKSKGNVITPVDLIEEKGADVVRFWASTSRLGCDTAFSEDVLKIGRKLVTKLWNATKFAAIHLDKLQEKPGTALADVENKTITEPLDLWILTRLKRAITIATQEFDKYEYCDARVAAEDFFWNDFCDNYLELVKGRVYGENPNISKTEQKSAVYTIYHCLDGILRLFAPIVPHVTDELYTHIFDDKVAAGGSIHARGNWPDSSDYPEDKQAESAGIAAVGVLNAVRKLKAERNVSIKWPLNFISITGDGAEKQLTDFTNDLKNVTSATDIIFVEKAAADGQKLTTKTDDGKFEVSVEFSQNASNSDAA